MAADDETCHGNVNFAIICSFISKFGEEFGLPSSVPTLQRMLEDTENVEEELKEIHIKLLRKARKWFNKEKWERALVKFCHEYSSVDAWEIERFGYKKAKLSVKLELLKRLLELQFDCNAKFKGEVNKLDALSLRVLPIGRDRHGHLYWYQLDKECNLRLYMQEVEEEGSWKLLCSTKEDLETLLEKLGNKIDSKEVKEAVEEGVKAEVKPEAELKSEIVEEKDEECKVIESNSIETVLIKQEVDEKSSACHSNDKECSVEKQEVDDKSSSCHSNDKECSVEKLDDAEHQNVNSTSSLPKVASGISGNKIPLKDCIVNLESGNINLKDTSNENYVKKAVASDTNESKTNNDAVVIKQESVAVEPTGQVHLIVSEVNLNKSEKEVSKSFDPSERKSPENATSSLTVHSEVVNRSCENEKDCSTVLNKCANAKNSDNEPKKLMHEGPVVEQLSSVVKSGNSESIVEKQLSGKLPFPESVAVKEAHSNKVSSAITSLLSENVDTLFDHRNVNIDKKKQGERSRMLYKGPPVIRNMSVCDEVPMDLSTTGRSRESRNESFILSRPEHEYEIPGNYKAESFITKIERQLTKMCEDTESIKYRRNDKISFSGKHHKLRRNESCKKLHAKSIDHLQLNKMNVEKQNLGNQTSVSVIVGENFLTKDSAEQTRQSVICEIKNSKLISNEKNQISSDNGNHVTSSNIANNHCVSNVTPASGLQTTEKSPDRHDKGGVIQAIGHVSPSEKTSFLSPKTDNYNNIAISERKNLGFRKCLLNEFKADKCGAKSISPSDNLIKDELEDVSVLSKTTYKESKSSNKVNEYDKSDPLNKCEDAEQHGKRENSEVSKPVSETFDKSKVTKPLSKDGESEDTKLIKEKDICEGTKHSSENDICEDAHTPLNTEIKCKESQSVNKEKCAMEPLRKEKKSEEVKPVNKEDPRNEVKPLPTEGKCSLVEPLIEGQREEAKQISKGGKGEVNTFLNKKDKSKQLSSIKGDCEEKSATKVLCKKISKKPSLESSVQSQERCDASDAHCVEVLVTKKDSLNDSEFQQDKKTVENCNTSEIIVSNKTASQKTQPIAAECDAGVRKSTSISDVGETNDSEKCRVEGNAADSVENDERVGKQSCDMENIERCVEIPKLDQDDRKSGDDGCSDAKTKDIPESEKANLKEKEPGENDILTVQTESENDVVSQQISEINCKDKTLGDESDTKADEDKSKDCSENKNSSKSDKNIDVMKNGDLREKECDVNNADKRLEDGMSSVKNETGIDKLNTDLVLKETEHEEKPQVKGKLRRSSRTSRGYSEAPKSELESSELCKSELEKNRIQANEQKTNEVHEKDSGGQKCPEVNTSDLKPETDTGKKNSEEMVCGSSNMNEKDSKCDKNFCEIVDIENEHDGENKQRKTATKRNKSTARRSRNLRKSVRNIPKPDISNEKCIASTVGDKTISNSDIKASDPAPPVSLAPEQLDKLKIKFTPLTKELQLTCVSEGHLCGMCTSNVCFETKTKYKGDIKVINNKHSKNKCKESFSKGLSKVVTDEIAFYDDHEESFSVGRMRTRGRLKRQCSVAAPLPPREPPGKSKAAASSLNKTAPSSQSKVAPSSASKPPAKTKVASPQVINSPVKSPKKRIRGKRASMKKAPLPDTILEIIGSSEEKNTSKNDKMKKVSDKKSNEIISCTLPMTENSENESTPVKRSRRIQEQNQKKISQLAVEMEQEQRRLEKLAKQNAAVAKIKQKEAVEKTQKSLPLQHQQQARPSKRRSKSEAKLPEPAIVEMQSSPRKTRNHSRNITKMTLIYEDDSKDLEYETSRDTIKSRRRRNGRRGRKKKYKPWDLSSESSSPSEEITEEEEEEQEELLVFNSNEDEFACEEVDENAEPVVIRRARTARKAKSASESESEAENVAPDDKPCAKCGQYDEPEWILLCDKCDSGYHTRCLAPPLMLIPDGDWYCPPCEHTFLIENLLVELRNLEQMLKQREREELRKQRLAYVGISLDNVLKPEKKEKQENESYDDDDSDETSEDDRIYSKRSSRTRRVVNYQFKEFDELIQSAIEEEMMEFKLPEKTEAGADSNEDSEADVVAPSRRKKKAHRLNDLDFTDVEDSDEEYKGSSLSETEVSQSPQSDGSNSQHSGSSASWRGGRKGRTGSGQKKHHKRKRSRNSGDSDYLDGEAFRPTTRRAAQKKISYRELSSDEEWGDDKPSKKWTKKRRQSSTSSESSDGSFRRQRSKKKARIVQKWKKSDSDSESEPKKTKSSVQKWQESGSESESKEMRRKSRVQRWEDSESGSDSGSRKVKKTRAVQKWEGSESESESDSKKSSSSDSETSGTSVQSAEKWKIKKSCEGSGIKININRKLLDSDSDSTSGQARHKKKNVSRIVDSEDSEESDEEDDASKKVSDEESTSESNTAQKGYKEDKSGSLKNVPSNSVKDVKSGPQITVTAAEKMPETVADQGPPKAAPHHIGIHLKGKASPSMQKVVKCVKPLARSLMKSDSEHKNFDSSISETFSNDSQSLQGLPTEHEEPMCESDSEQDPKLNRFSNDQYICKTEIFEKDSVYRPAKEDQSFNYNAAEEKSYQIPYTGLASLQDYPSRPSPLKPSMVETYSNSTSPSKLTPLDSYSEASSPKGFISLDSCSSFRKSSSFVSSDPEVKSRPILTSDNYQGEIRFPQEQYPPYERPSHLSPAPCPSSPAAFPQSPSARENASPPRMYSQYPESYAGQRSPDYYHGQQYYSREEGVPRQNYVSNFSSSENASPYPYNTNSSQQPNGGFMIDTLLRSRNPDGEEDELTGVTDIVSYITQE